MEKTSKLNALLKRLNITDGVKKKLSLIAMLLALTEYVFVLVIFPLFSIYPRGYNAVILGKTNIFADQSFVTILLALLYLLLLLLSAFSLLMLFKRIKNRFTRICSFAPIASILFLIITVIYVTSISVRSTEIKKIVRFKADPIIWLLFLIHFAIILLTLIITIDIKQKPETDVLSSNHITDNIEAFETDARQIPQEQAEGNTKETIIIKGKIKKSYETFIVAGGIIILFPMLLYALNIGGCREYRNSSAGFFECLIFRFASNHYHLGSEVFVPIIFYIGLIIAIVGLVLLFAYRKVSITVTNKRVYGTAAWGKRVDLPLDMISAVATSFFHGIAVASSAGSIHFKMIENNKDVHEEISKLLMERQKQEVTVTTNTVKEKTQLSNADELKKFKELLDIGAITQEEFDAKKKQLLGL